MKTKGRYIYKAMVTNVVDGDTIDVEIDLGFQISTVQRLRLMGIDTPEIRGPEKKEGLKVKQYVKDLIEGKEILIETHKVGKFGRYVVDIWVDGLNLTRHLLENKMGTVPPYLKEEEKRIQARLKALGY